MNETIFAAPEQSTVQIEEIFFSWLLTMVACWTWSAGYEVAESGADLDLVSFASFIFSSCIFIIMKRRTFWTKIWWYWLIVINTYFHLPSSNTRTFWWCRTIRYQPPTKELTFYHDFASQSTADVPLLMTIFSSRVGFCNKVELTKYYYNLSVHWVHQYFHPHDHRHSLRCVDFLFLCRWCGSWIKCSSLPTLGWSAGCTMTSSSSQAETTGTQALSTLKGIFQRFCQIS